MSTAYKHHVIVIGAGFGGLEATRALVKIPGMRVTLIDKTNHHLFQPLLYQVATAGLAAPSIAAPVRTVMHRFKQVCTLQAEVTAIDASANTVTLANGMQLDYDWLIVAAGATHSYFGNDQWRHHAPGLKTLRDAFTIRSRVVEAFERAELEPDPQTRQALLTFAVIGAGPTGVEMAGTLAEIARHTLKDEFRNIDPAQARVFLIEGGPRVLQSMPPRLSERAKQQLERLGVTVMLDTRVTHIDGTGLRYEQMHAGNGPERSSAPHAGTLASRCIIWAAGVAASPLGKTVAAATGAALDRAGRVKVTPQLTVDAAQRIFVIGDLAAALSHEPGKEPTPVPGVSPAAKQMGQLAAANIRHQIEGTPMASFRYRNYGNLATIGRNAAVVDLPMPFGKHLRFSGLLAWQFWLFAHVYFLIGFRNRLVVLMDWASAYWTYRRHARVVAPMPPVSDLLAMEQQNGPDRAASDQAR
ncbi:pyridine nucleotide-disulfide oxidoreductase [Lampropedia cohaerens]|uniref:Pyridine nucleotide-disulfide oxidoreductase n=1 Tax=Lampropedia cohaerens TaxID=1610491 RepID=A0A0U1PWN9_9BURK|nr:NAD(P)/FAD-dependent oxidoreductase [Lampropedia cohaerens]KKW66948.1 pyridine nucleotide-disulfide oxidoreductase [Lampropedia cohaerens]